MYFFRAVVPENSGPVMPGQKVKTRTCDLDSKDPLWSEHKGSPFPTVAEAIQEDLDKYRFDNFILYKYIFLDYFLSSYIIRYYNHYMYISHKAS